jgi:hypothetical protein
VQELKTGRIRLNTNVSANREFLEALLDLAIFVKGFLLPFNPTIVF